MNRVGAILLDFYSYIMYNMVMLVEVQSTKQSVGIL